MNYTPVIGLEVHVELKTKSKMFCSCSSDYFGAQPNTHTCPVCLGLPGALPVPNKKAIEWCVAIGMALNCKIPDFAKFDRKNYFYPDLAKGYQISQYDQPFAINGFIEVEGVKLHYPKGVQKKRIGITRVHMEEDTAKLTHQTGIQNSEFRIQNDEGYSLIDFNRSGVPLVEIVTEPDFTSAEEVVEYLKKLQQIVRYLGVSNADMEKGDMRLEPNISLRPVILASETRPESNGDAGQASMTSTGLPKYKVEVKNINSFRFVDRAIAYEIKRQTEILDRGETPAQETRGWNEAKNATISQRSKEDAHDYRYFPEPDITPIRWEKSQITKIKSQMGELPDAKFERFKKEYALSPYDAEILTRERVTADYFEEACRVLREITNHKSQITNKTIANWMINKKVDTENILPAELIKSIIQSSTADTIDEKELDAIITKVLAENEKAVHDHKNGKEQSMQFLVGQVMREAKRKLDTKKIEELIKQKLTS